MTYWDPAGIPVTIGSAVHDGAGANIPPDLCDLCGGRITSIGWVLLPTGRIAYHTCGGRKEDT